MPWEVQYIVVIIAALIRPSSLHSMHRWCNDKETPRALDTCGKSPNLWAVTRTRWRRKMRQDTSVRYDTDLSATGVNNRRREGGGGAFQTSPNKWRVVEYERGWSEFAPILYPFKGHFLCYWLAVVHTWQLRSPGEAVSGGTRPTWNAHTGEEIGLETNRHTEDAAARWGNWKIQKGRGNEETRPLTSFILKSCFLIRTQSVRYGPNNTWNARILSGCVRTTLPSFHGHKYCDLEKSMLYREGGVKWTASHWPIHKFPFWLFCCYDTGLSSVECGQMQKALRASSQWNAAKNCFIIETLAAFVARLEHFECLPDAFELINHTVF